MTAFEFFSVALSFVLGLGVTRLLLGGLHVFRARRRQKPHWIPLVWALSIFVYQLQYWWAVFELNEALPIWTHQAFLTLMLHALLLFVGGALVLPVSEAHERDDLMDYFDDDGRWALLALTAYALLSFWTNWALFSTSPLSNIGLIVFAFAVLSFAGFFVRNRRYLGIVTVVYLAHSMFAFVTLAPRQYP